MCQAVSASAACCMTMSTSASLVLCFCVVRCALFMAGDGNFHGKIDGVVKLLRQVKKFMILLRVIALGLRRSAAPSTHAHRCHASPLAARILQACAGAALAADRADPLCPFGGLRSAELAKVGAAARCPAARADRRSSRHPSFARLTLTALHHPPRAQDLD